MEAGPHHNPTRVLGEGSGGGEGICAREAPSTRLHLRVCEVPPHEPFFPGTGTPLYSLPSKLPLLHQPLFPHTRAALHST